MPSRSSANLLDLTAVDSTFSSSPHHPACLPYVMVDPCILSTTGVADGGSPSATPKRRIIVSHHLPIRATTDPAAPSGWSSYDPGTLVLQLRSGLPVGAEVLHIGTLYGLSTASTRPAHHDAVAASTASSAMSPSSSPPTSMPTSTIASVSTTSGPSSTTSSPSIPRPSLAYVSMETLGDTTSTKPQSPPPDCPSPLLFFLP